MHRRRMVDDGRMMFLAIWGQTLLLSLYQRIKDGNLDMKLANYQLGQFRYNRTGNPTS